LKAQTVLDLIENGEWHTLKELAQRLKVPLNEVIKTVKSLSKHKIVIHLEETQQVRLSSWIRTLAEDLTVENEKEALGTIILPPKGIIAIQDTVISNLTEDDLEIGVRIDRKLKELAISKV